MLFEVATGVIIGVLVGAVFVWRQWNVVRSQNPSYCSVLSGVPGLRRVLVCKRTPKGDWGNDTPVIYDAAKGWSRKREQGDYYVYETTLSDIPEPRWAVLY